MDTSSPGAERPTRVRWIIFVLACAVSWLLYLHRYSWGLVKPAFLAENPEITPTEVGWLDSAFMAAYALGQVPGGLAGDLLGPRGVLAGMILIWSGTVAAVAWTGGFWRLIGVRAAFGLAQAGAYPIISKMTRTWFPLSVRTSVQGIVAAMGRVGGATASVIIGTLLLHYLNLSWQHALLVLTVPGVVLAVLFWFLARNSPRQHPWANEAEQELVDAGSTATPPGEPMKLHLGGRSLLNLGMLLIYAFASTFQDQLYVFWIPLFLQQGRGLNAGEMGLFSPLPLIGGVVGGILGGILNDALIRRWGDRKWARRAVGFSGKAIAAVLVFMSLQVSDGRHTMVVLMVARFFGDWSLPTQWGAVTDMGGRAAATVFGLVNMIGAVGGFVAGPVLGYLRQHYGWEGLFYGVAAMCLVSALTWLFIDCTRRLVDD
jgi:MFS transporter, ACS family, glucarate transporter